MDKSSFIWDINHNRKIKMGAIKEFMVRQSYNSAHKWEVVACLTGGDFPIVYGCEDKQQAISWIDDITY
jgi:hypothetical protein